MFTLETVDESYFVLFDDTGVAIGPEKRRAWFTSLDEVITGPYIKTKKNRHMWNAAKNSKVLARLESVDHIHKLRSSHPELFI